MLYEGLSCRRLHSPGGWTSRAATRRVSKSLTGHPNSTKSIDNGPAQGVSLSEPGLADRGGNGPVCVASGTNRGSRPGNWDCLEQGYRAYEAACSAVWRLAPRNRENCWRPMSLGLAIVPGRRGHRAGTTAAPVAASCMQPCGLCRPLQVTSDETQELMRLVLVSPCSLPHTCVVTVFVVLQGKNFHHLITIAAPSTNIAL